MISLLHDYVSRHARLHGGDVAAVMDDRSLTYAELDARAGAIAAGLAALGIGPGDEPVKVKLSRPRDCGRWRYLSVRYRYTGAVPAGARRSRLVRLDSTC